MIVFSIATLLTAIFVDHVDRASSVSDAPNGASDFTVGIYENKPILLSISQLAPKKFILSLVHDGEELRLPVRDEGHAWRGPRSLEAVVRQVRAILGDPTARQQVCVLAVWMVQGTIPKDLSISLNWTKIPVQEALELAHPPEWSEGVPYPEDNDAFGGGS